MGNLRDLRTRIRSVKATQKITSAMKVVAASRLRWAQAQVEAVRPYETNMQAMAGHLLQGRQDLKQPLLLLTGHPHLKTHLLIIMTADRGLCGSFNSAITREAKSIIKKLQAEGKEVKIFCIGRKGKDILRQDYGKFCIDIPLSEMPATGTAETDPDKRHSFTRALSFAATLQSMLEEEQFGEASVLFTVFRSALHQQIEHHPLVPFPLAPAPDESARHALYEYEPDLDALVKHLLARYCAIHLYRVFLESQASEQGARMMAMDHATRNASDMIQRLERTYNQTRQAFITRELIEIISAAEAVT